MKNSEYKMLDNLMKGYLNMDAHDITGADTLEGMLDYYLKDCKKSDVLFLKAEIVLFTEKKPSKEAVQEEFEKRYPHELDVGDVSKFLEVLYRKCTASELQIR